jgi:hypothetical protein
VFVIEPFAQPWQSSSSLDPTTFAYFPAAQSVHVLTADDNEYLPRAHLLHTLAFVRVPVFVIEPAGHSTQPVAPINGPLLLILPRAHSVHALRAELAEYCPTAHFIHEVADIDGPVSVIEPAAQTVQLTTLEAVEN